MAEDSGIPPLEDMTEVLKQASALRAGFMDPVADGKPQVTSKTAKDRAKVKKNISAKVVNLETVNSDESAGDHKIKSTEEPSPRPEADKSLPSPSPVTPKAINAPSGGSFGGLKKGFLFGGPPKNSGNSNKSINNVESVKPGGGKEEKSEVKKEKDDIPLIVPKTGKTQSDLTINEVQQAMTEAKGLLDDQDWITDDLLNNVEKNELLLKRFADPHFMKALQEFQTNPTAAMEKYKGNQEVEKFLAEFCGLLGDHFTNLGTPSDNAAKSKPSRSTQSDTPSKISELPDKKNQPKIIEIVDNKSEPSVSVFQENDITSVTNKCPKIIEIPENDKSLKLSPEVRTQKTKIPGKDKVKSPVEETDIQGLPGSNDEVKEMLNDPRVMEILMDARVMNLIQLLRSDPDAAQRTVDAADLNFKDKIKFLVSKGLLQFHNY